MALISSQCPNCLVCVLAAETAFGPAAQRHKDKKTRTLKQRITSRWICCLCSFLTARRKKTRRLRKTKIGNQTKVKRIWGKEIQRRHTSPESNHQAPTWRGGDSCRLHGHRLHGHRLHGHRLHGHRLHRHRLHGHRLHRYRLHRHRVHGRLLPKVQLFRPVKSVALCVGQWAWWSNTPGVTWTIRRGSVAFVDDVRRRWRSWDVTFSVTRRLTAVTSVESFSSPSPAWEDTSHDTTERSRFSVWTVNRKTLSDVFILSEL